MGIEMDRKRKLGGVQAVCGDVIIEAMARCADMRRTGRPVGVSKAVRCGCCGHKWVVGYVNVVDRSNQGKNEGAEGCVVGAQM